MPCACVVQLQSSCLTIFKNNTFDQFTSHTVTIGYNKSIDYAVCREIANYATKQMQHYAYLELRAKNLPHGIAADLVRYRYQCDINAHLVDDRPFTFKHYVGDPEQARHYAVRQYEGAIGAYASIKPKSTPNDAFLFEGDKIVAFVHAECMFRMMCGLNLFVAEYGVKARVRPGPKFWVTYA